MWQRGRPALGLVSRVGAPARVAGCLLAFRAPAACIQFHPPTRLASSTVVQFMAFPLGIFFGGLTMLVRPGAPPASACRSRATPAA